MEERRSFHFKGEGTDLFVVILKNIFFTLITLGIYFPFAKTNLRKFFWNNLELKGEKFQYIGTGMEILKGYLIAGAVLFGYQVVFAIVTSILPEASIFVVLTGAIALLFIVPTLIFGSHRYLLTRTQYRGIKFGVNPEGKKQITKEFFKAVILSPLTLGIYNIAFFFIIRKVLLNHSYYGNEKITYDGDTSEFFWKNFLGAILSYITMGIYFPWLMAWNIKYHSQHTVFQGNRFNIDVTGQDLLILYLKNILFFALSLGLATPWIATLNMTFYVERLSLEGDIEFDRITKSPYEKGGELSDGFSDVLEVDIGL
jgi:uncharacterized membrane protein YjgN (DUF898 family)